MQGCLCQGSISNCNKQIPQLQWLKKVNLLGHALSIPLFTFLVYRWGWWDTPLRNSEPHVADVLPSSTALVCSRCLGLTGTIIQLYLKIQEAGNCGVVLCSGRRGAEISVFSLDTNQLIIFRIFYPSGHKIFIQPFNK